MTAEIAVMNREAVALAADSAVSGPKIFTSANKIFALSKYHPVAVMVYDSAQFLDVPWETIVKRYRSELGNRSFPTLRDQAANFLGFFDQPNPLFPHAAQERANESLIWRYFRAMLLEIDSALESRTSEGEELTTRQISDEAGRVVAEQHDLWMHADDALSLPQDHVSAVREKYEEAIARSIDDAFEDLPLSDDAISRLHDLAAALVSKNFANPLSPYHSGVVIAGFGQRDYFPSLYEFDLETIALNRLKYIPRGATHIGEQDGPAVIRPFAQREQVSTFIEGIDPVIKDATLRHWSDKLTDLIGATADRLKLARSEKDQLINQMAAEVSTAVDEFADDLRGLSQDRYVEPIIRVVAMMPKDELAAMAESLVNLTSFKRKITEDAETVGGPIDVAVISRGDGMVWVKRKHYFSPELNPQFFANYYREEA